jgi:hypothetical protein
MATIAAGTNVSSATETRGSRYACRSASGIVTFSLLSFLDFYLLMTLFDIPLQWCYFRGLTLPLPKARGDLDQPAGFSGTKIFQLYLNSHLYMLEHAFYLV